MEIHDYLEHGFRILSNRTDSATPEILEHAADVQFQGVNKDKIIELKLAGTKDNELYRLLILFQCDDLHKSMPFLFYRIDNETELLLPDNLLHSDSPIRKMISEVDESDWNDVEIIGWIYQFYISERKDEVIGKVLKSEDIPAATQLFTPNWIVKYMVQNTLGRLWLTTYPDSPLKNIMEYYIEPTEQKPEVQKRLDENTPKELNPEEITFLDPSCGSGHILVEAYDVLKEIYLERGYRTRDIPRLIMEKNIYGLDICDRAAQLSYFSVLMKAREDDRKILERNSHKANVIAIQETRRFNSEDIADKLTKEKVDRFDGENQLFPDFKGQMALRTIEKPIVSRKDIVEFLQLFNQGKTYGSLITIPENISVKIPQLISLTENKLKKGDIFEREAAYKLKTILHQLIIINRKYDCVVTNPPYIGWKGMNGFVRTFLKDYYTDVKSDLFSAFIVRNTEFAKTNGQLGFMSPFVWMFISSYEKLRRNIIDQRTITSLVRLEYSGFDGATVPICTFTLRNDHHIDFKGCYVSLSEFRGSENQGPKTLEAINNPNCGWFYQASASDFKRLPGSPIAFWVPRTAFDALDKTIPLGNISDPRKGMCTRDNDYFVRAWYEVSFNRIGFGCTSRDEALSTKKRWFPYQKGGEFRQWYGNHISIVDWENDGYRLLNMKKLGWKGNSTNHNLNYIFKPAIVWSKITSAIPNFRYSPPGFLYDDASGLCSIHDTSITEGILGFLCSKVAQYLMGVINPTLNIQPGNMVSMPFYTPGSSNNIKKILSISKKDWDSNEISWDFTKPPLLQTDYQQSTLKVTYQIIRKEWLSMVQKMKGLEEENNRIFREAYGLQNELTPDVQLSEITLKCNPQYRFGGKKAANELEILLQTDTIKELISYAIGCMMGRYSLDTHRLVYAHSANIDFDPSKYKTFYADDDGIIPIMDMDWFSDDASNRLLEFFKVAWPEEKLNENLKFVADSLKSKRDETPIETIRRYLSTNFFKDHLKTYKKRPIYWMFSSGKHKAFECLVYLHRYNESILSRMRSTYVTPLQSNFISRLEFLKDEKEAASTTSTKNKFQKEIDQLKKKQTELSKFDDELRHYADMKIPLDLDDGVKANYGKFGNLLAMKKAITGKK